MGSGRGLSQLWREGRGGDGARVVKWSEIRQKGRRLRQYDKADLTRFLPEGAAMSQPLRITLVILAVLAVFSLWQARVEYLRAEQGVPLRMQAEATTSIAGE